MRTLLSERGQVVIPKKIRDDLHVQKGDKFEVEAKGDVIILRPIRKFKAKKWQDYVGISEGVVDAYLRDKEKEKTHEEVYP